MNVNMGIFVGKKNTQTQNFYRTDGLQQQPKDREGEREREWCDEEAIDEYKIHNNRI